MYDYKSVIRNCQVRFLLLTYEARSPQVTGKRKNTPVKAGVFGKASVRGNYSLSEAGSDRFLGDFLLSMPMSSRAEGGTATAPLRTILSSSTFLLYPFSLAPYSGRRDDPSTVLPGTKRRPREPLSTTAGRMTPLSASATG